MLHNIEFERAILSALLSTGSGFEKIESKLDASDFAFGQHQNIFATIEKLHTENQPYDMMMVLDDMISHGYDKQETESLFNVITETAGFDYNLVHFAEKVKDLSVRRTAEAKLRNGLDGIQDLSVAVDSTVNDAISDLNNVLNSASNDAYTPVGNLINDFYKRLIAVTKEGFVPFVDTGIITLNNHVKIEAGDLCVVAARPSMGKTTLAQNIMRNIIKTSGKTGVFFSLEMTAESVMQRLVSDIGTVNLTNIRSGDLNINNDQYGDNEWGRMMGALQEIQDLNMVIDDTSELTVEQMRSRLNSIRKDRGEIGVIMIDYIQIMGGIDDNNPVRSIGKITRRLKAFGKEFGCPVIALSQLNRSLESRGNKRPIMSDLRESGAIEQDADQILFIYRDEVYNADSKEKGTAEIIVGKQRNGPVGSIRLGFEGQFSRFKDLPPTHNFGGEYD